ncbi:GDP-mannose mannosyl hydrolase [Pseudoalteromonas sp. BSi20495]|uniref:GDP-mannose mannosyl hydrolase n=1 Tax=Pseudoalteromonas sp. BSi20495 TaxID=386429 RepID=UPI0002315D29|nr:GDP-mannose mannosyl hydrolase [Pseudoalteromonas sp. BSi20495]GAA77709.1 GDP-mannose mannosyl hydrolase [Pseudoalteromonas sp. BSi20495]
MFLDNATFTTVIDSTPLVSMDLVAINEQGQALLGERLNRPAQGYWFVPGGRILKNEPLEHAFKRLTLEELGSELAIESAELLGPYDHFYNDSVFGEHIKTHYVAIAYIVRVSAEQLSHLPINEQHGSYKWFDMADLKYNPQVHIHTKWYFDAITTKGI